MDLLDASLHCSADEKLHEAAKRFLESIETSQDIQDHSTDEKRLRIFVDLHRSRDFLGIIQTAERLNASQKLKASRER